MWVVLVLVALCAGDQIGSVGPECAACGFLANEVEGFLAENRTLSALEQFLENDVCVFLSPSMRGICDMMVSALPQAVAYVDQGVPVAAVCVDMGACNVSLSQEPDMQAVPTLTFDLDLPPVQRWSTLCSLPHVRQTWQHLFSILQNILHPEFFDALADLGKAARLLMPPEYASEILSCSNAAGVDPGVAAVLNMAYELQDTPACTSIVAQSPAGAVWHARNIDFGMGGFLSDAMKNCTAVLQVKKGGRIIGNFGSIMGFVGSLSGQSLPGHSTGFTLTVNTRFQSGSFFQGLYQYLTEFVFGIEHYPHVKLATFLSRDVIINARTFDEAVQMLSTTELMVNIYYTISGSAPGQGAVISRNRTGAVNVHRLNPSNGTWFVLQTNYDWWTKQPWIDDRYDAGVSAMNLMTQQNVGAPGLFNVLSTRPVLNLLTTYSVVAENAAGSFNVKNRNCPFPCPM